MKSHQKLVELVYFYRITICRIVTLVEYVLMCLSYKGARANELKEICSTEPV